MVSRESADLSMSTSPTGSFVMMPVPKAIDIRSAQKSGTASPAIHSTGCERTCLTSWREMESAR